MAKEKTSALHSRYIIDGVKMELTPAQLLEAVAQQKSVPPIDPHNIPSIVDETVETGLNPFTFDPDKVQDYLSMVLRTKRVLPVAYSDTYTRSLIATALLDSMWLEGSFKLGDLVLKICWKWDEKPVGNMAAFYASALAAADYTDCLGLRIDSYSYGNAAQNSMTVKTAVRREPDEDDLFELPYSSAAPVMKKRRSLPSSLVPDPQSWIVYIPFDTAPYRFGGSILSQALGRSGGVSLSINDADYFIDCFEVVRELVEDGILLSAETVSEGGLMASLKRMCSEASGASVDISDLMKSSGQSDMVRLLFAEVPGVIVQIRDIDFDYLDAELLLQDVAYFPLGHPVPLKDEVVVSSGEKSGIQKILESLIQNQCGEGED